jgi:non-specific serine/threonine protein kinase
MEWSYNLLEDDEKKLFARLAVFRGGRSLEAIEAVCGDGLSASVLDGLASLMDKSLVHQKKAATGEPRFVLLEMIHELAREKLEANGEADTIRRRHADYFVALAERADPELRLSRYGYWCQRFELELDNFRAVLEWALSTGDITLGVRLAGALGMFWYSKGYHVEGLRWTRLLLERLDETPAIFHARFLIGAGRVAFMVDLDAARRLFARALDTSRVLGDRLQEAWALAFQGYITLEEPEAGMEMAETSLAIFREMDHQPGIAQALNIIGELARVRGDDEHAKRAYEECLAVCQQTGEVNRTCYNYANLAFVAQHEGDHELALRLVRQALQLSHDAGGARDVASFLATFAGSIAALGQPLPAARLLGASEAALERTGAFYQPTDKLEIDRTIATVRAQLDDTAFQAMWSEGRGMGMDEAIEYALGGVWIKN